jgi:DNA repair exonuclease SbcCD nuclease subunit
MIKKIIQISDIHIPNYKRIEEYQTVLHEFLKQARDIIYEAGGDGEDSVRIVVCGDLVNSHNEVSNEAYVVTGWFLKELDKLCPTIVFAGNHDKTSNIERTDTLSALFLNTTFTRTTYLDKKLEFQSDCFVDDNIVWCLFSAFDDFKRPPIEEYKEKYGDKTFVGLFHGDMVSAKTDVGFVTTLGENPSHFEGVNFGLMGHIHKRQCIKNNGVPLVYGGSLIQQNFGENVSGHGYVLWDVESETFEFKDIDNEENSFYVVSINSTDDLDNDLEEFINL